MHRPISLALQAVQVKRPRVTITVTLSLPFRDLLDLHPSSSYESIVLVVKEATREDDMATKQARQLVPGDIVSLDGHTRVTVARIFPAFGGVAVGVEWSTGQVSHFQPHDVLTVTHVNTIGGAL